MKDGKLMVKVLKSKWWNICFPAGVFFIVAAAEGAAYWIAGVSFIIWLWTMLVKYVIAPDK